VTPLDFAAAHPFVAVALVVSVGVAIGQAVAAPFNAVGRWRRHPLDCPRCHGTGRDRR
jgi:hypothetical protein